MAKYGKWIGGGLGWAFGGPIGGLLGFVFGSIFDNMQSGTFEYKGTTRGGDFAASLLILSAAVMRADDKVMKSELSYVRAFFLAQFGQEKTEESMGMLRELLKRDIPVDDVCRQIEQYMDAAARLQLLHYLFGIALSDQQSHPNEIRLIEQIATKLGITHADFTGIKSMFVKDSNAAYAILQISPDASDEEVKKAYRKLAVQYHPDKLTHLGEEFQHAAKEKFQKINAAYEEIKKQRGIK